ncbi:uncharacterized protein EV154DRAFT_526749 [Mucor mucedo]|uniref:uncharacterized protein n=1 Tax=Mucor mucedo TaxID=29922 RepID=UPI00221EAEE8|nr:uncharacterized protein EV154DRAFT_526749 [Mucor mucedo]KAI7875271.1 hypothetical protein EV154DRAFT_526749 [Mucor mucedo]
MAFKKPVSDDLYKTAREEVEAAGGKVLYEYKSALKGILVQLPSQEFNIFSSKPYVDFFEKDSSVHI